MKGINEKLVRRVADREKTYLLRSEAYIGSWENEDPVIVTRTRSDDPQALDGFRYDVCVKDSFFGLYLIMASFWISEEAIRCYDAFVCEREVE